MEIQIRKLNLIFKFTELNPGMFYNISATNYGIKFMGEFNESILSFAYKHKFEVKISENGFLRLTRKDFEIVITE